MTPDKCQTSKQNFGQLLLQSAEINAIMAEIEAMKTANQIFFWKTKPGLSINRSIPGLQYSERAFKKKAAEIRRVMHTIAVEME
jgi:hypothetical protein